MHSSTLISLTLIFLIATVACSNYSSQLKRISYKSHFNGGERDFFLYLPKGYDEGDKNWPVIMFLHGNGERGNGKDELDYVLVHGPLMEAWIQKRDLPFIIISPQLHMFDMDQNADYLANRDSSIIPQRLEKGVPERLDVSRPKVKMDGASAEIPDFVTLPNGWDRVEQDLNHILDKVTSEYQADASRVYLTGISYGGFGTWYMASKYPDRFAAIAPVAGWGHPSLMESIANQKLPVWVFAGGRDPVIKAKHFYPGVNKLEELGHSKTRFTIHEDMGHDVWKRVYAGEDLYQWLLEH